MTTGIPEESEVLLREVGDLAEAFITDLKRGRLPAARSGEESLSTTAAVKMSDMMANIVRLFQRAEEDPRSRTVQLLKAGYPATEVASLQVSRLLMLIARTGDSLLRAQFATLLLMNVTRRVLSILRESAAANKASDAELELDAKALLETLESDVSEDEGKGRLQGSSHNDCHGDDQEDNEEEQREEEEEEEQMNRPLGARAGLPARGDPPASPALKKNVLSTGADARRSLSVRFSGGQGGAEAAAAAAAGSHAAPAPSYLAQQQYHSASMVTGFANPLLQRAGSIVAMELPGRQMLKRAPSRREQVLAEDPHAEFPVRTESFYLDALDAIDELKRELEGMTEELCRRAPRQLHSSDTIITLGCSHSIRRYLLEAAKAGHHFKVLILEGAPQPAQATHELAQALTEARIHAQTIPDSSAYVVMSMCTKVLVGAENVLANGGMLSAIGTHVLCAAARHFAVPVLVATTTLKMSPYYPSDQLCTRLVRIARSGAQEMPWSTYGSPEDVWPSPFGMTVGDSGRGLTIHAPVTEYVPPELITLFVTNDSELMPSQIHRIVRANYSDAD